MNHGHPKFFKLPRCSALSRGSVYSTSDYSSALPRLQFVAMPGNTGDELVILPYPY